MFKRFIIISLTAAVLLGQPAASTAPAADEELQGISELTADTPDEEAVKPADIAVEFGISQDSVECLKVTYRIGYGGLSKALAIARRADVTTEEILLLKTQKKMGWGQIVQSLELEPGTDYQIDDETLKETDEHLALKQEQIERRMDKQIAKAEKRSERNEGKKTR